MCEYILDEDATVEDLIAAASENLEKGATITDQDSGYEVETDDVFENGARFVIVPSTTGA
jgi:hypothetical protein